jgi:ABC-type glutathione transport system ATPase component
MTTTPDQYVLECVDLRKTYPNGKEAVKGVSLAIRPGETHGLVGESGSGKSTVSRMALMLERPTSGIVRLLGTDLTSLSSSQLRKRRGVMQLVMQDPVAALNRSRSVGHAVELPLQLHTTMSRAERHERVGELFDLVGLERGMASRHPAELSGGQCQRIGIARALALNPELVVLDEAVSAIDVVMQAQILNLLRDLQERLGLTYLFVSHDLAVVKYMSHTMTVMRDGIVEEQGAGDVVFRTSTNPYTRELIDAVPRFEHVGTGSTQTA